MGKKAIQIRQAEERDFPFLLRVNEENVAVLSPMDQAKLERFAASAELFLIAEADGAPAAFLIALREGIGWYDSENYLWFSGKYAKFLYIDRVVIDAPYRGLGIGRQLYQTVFEHAHLTDVSSVTAEIDTIPYNGASLKFHAAMGFQEVGTQMIRGGSMKVSLQEASV